MQDEADEDERSFVEDGLKPKREFCELRNCYRRDPLRC